MGIETGLAMAAFQGGASFLGAQQQNSALSAAMRSARQATMAQQQQVANAAATERQQIAREAAQARGRLRVASAAAGGGQSAALDRQLLIDSERNRQILLANEANQQTRLRSGYQADLASLESRAANPLLDMLTGAINGFGTGLSLGNAMEDVE